MNVTTQCNRGRAGRKAAIDLDDPPVSAAETTAEIDLPLSASSHDARADGHPRRANHVTPKRPQLHRCELKTVGNSGADKNCHAPGVGVAAGDKRLPPPTVAGSFDDIFLDDRELAARWNCSPKTLRNQRSLRMGCPYVHLGRLVRYRLSDVLAFEADGRIGP